jgi:tetratricopeptide (TPR) repeat protein
MVETKLITTVICAFNAEHTIERALASALQAADNPILLVDDFSTDQTAHKAQSLAGNRLSIVSPSQKIGIGNARQTAIEAIQTPYGLWLDADDEIRPSRPQNILKALTDSGADLIYDCARLIDEETQTVTAELPIPNFLRKQDGLLRLLERNWIPALCGGFRTEHAKKIGYDTSFLNSEDYDFLLRSLMENARINFLAESGYSYYHSDTSISRNIRRASNFTSMAISKFSIEQYQKQLNQSALPHAEQAYILACILLMTGQHAALRQYVAQTGDTQGHIAPYHQEATGLLSYLRGTAQLFLAGYDEALKEFAALKSVSPEFLNNQGVALKLSGQKAEAATAFRQATKLLPGYLDAVQNLQHLDDQDFKAITLLPLRPIADRSDYNG